MRTSTVVRTSPRIFFLQYPDACDQASTIKHPEVTIFEITASLNLPWVPEVFLACGGNFPCWPKAEATSGEAARKTSGTERCFLPSPLTFELFYRITFTPIRLKVSDCDHVGRHVKKCPKTHIILRKTSSSLKFIALRAIMTGSNRSSP